MAACTALRLFLSVVLDKTDSLERLLEYLNWMENKTVFGLAFPVSKFPVSIPFSARKQARDSILFCHNLGTCTNVNSNDY